MDRRPPLFQFDPGWLWIAAGLVIVFVSTVVPAQRALEEDRADLRQLQSAERRVYRLLEAHDRFLADLREPSASVGGGVPLPEPEHAPRSPTTPARIARIMNPQQIALHCTCADTKWRLASPS